MAARPIATTTQLAELVRDAIPAPARRTGGHPAKRTFQAIRIAVNEELDVLPTALDQALDALVPGGRCAVLSYHSGRTASPRPACATAPPAGGAGPVDLPPPDHARPTLRLLKAGAWTAPADEQAANPRAASVRLRAAEKLGAAGDLPPPRKAPDEHRPRPASRALALQRRARPAPEPRPAPRVPAARPSAPAPHPSPHRPPPRTVRGRREHLRVVRPEERTARRLTPKAGVLLTGVVFVTLFAVAGAHTIIAQGQIRLDALDQRVRTEQARYQELRKDVAQMASPQRIVAAAEAQGMVSPQDLVYLQPDAAAAVASGTEHR